MIFPDEDVGSWRSVDRLILVVISIDHNYDDDDDDDDDDAFALLETNGPKYQHMCFCFFARIILRGTKI